MTEQTIKRLAFTNGQVVDCRRSTCEMTNLIISGGKVMGLGYLPDDDEGTTFYDIGNCLIVPHICDAYVSSENPSYNQLEQSFIRTGITAIGTQKEKTTNCGLRILPFKQPICDLKTDVFSDRDAVYPVDAEFLSVNGETKRWETGLCPLREFMLAFTQDKELLLRLGDAIQSGLISSLVSGKDSFVTSDLRSVFVSLIMSILSKELNWDWPDVFRVISLGCDPLFEQKLSTISLFSKPTFSIIDPKHEYTLSKEDVRDNPILEPLVNQPLIGKCLATVVNGDLIYNLIKPQTASDIDQQQKQSKF